MSIVGGRGAIGLQGEQAQTHRLLNSLPDEPVVSAVEWPPPYPRCSVCVCKYGWGEKVPRLRPLNFTSGCCLAGSFDQM